MTTAMVFSIRAAILDDLGAHFHVNKELVGIFAGKAFLYGLGALGGEGADYVIELFKEEVRDAMRQVGINSVAQARSIELLHPGVWRF